MIAEHPETPGPVAGPFVDRLFYEAIRQGMATFAAEPERWNEALGFLGETERKIAEVFWKRNPPTVRMGYARSNDPFPIVSVALTRESPADVEVFGDEFFDPEEDGDEFFSGQWRRYEIAITIHADHIDVATYGHRAIDAILNAHLDWFKSNGLINPVFVGAGDVMPEPQYLPEGIYSRVISWQAVGVAAYLKELALAPQEVSVVAEADEYRGAPGRARFGGVT